MDLCRAMDWLPSAAYITSSRAKPAALAAWHSPHYIAAVQDAEKRGEVDETTRARHNIGTPSNPVFAEMFRRPATSAGASLLAGEILAKPGIVYSPAGGTHHGMPDRANGFCYFNDPVLAILSLRRQGLNRIAYVDIDAHHPDGVEHAFADTPEVLLISVHEQNRWPRTGALTDRGAGNVYNLPVTKGFNDTEMALVRDQFILPVVAAHRPDAIVLQCGADAVLEDPQSRLALSNNAHWAIAAALRNLSDRYLVLGGGGYNPWSVGRLWSGIWATLNDIEIPDQLEPKAQEILRSLEWTHTKRGFVPPETWFTTLRDSPRDGQISPDLRADIARLTNRILAIL